MKRWLITGVSRGFGLSIARAALDRGDMVVGTVRDGVPPLDAPADRLRVMTLEMRDRGAVKRVVDTAFAEAGPIDVIVNNAGFGLLGAIGEASAEDVAAIFDVNFLGPLALIQAALPHLRAQRCGHIINITSIAGRAPGIGAGIYAAAKHAVEGLSRCLAQEVAPHGIRVTAVAPGAFRTDFATAHSLRTSTPDAGAWAESVDPMRAAFAASSGRQPGDPDRAAAAILKLADTAEPPLQLLLGLDAVKRERARLAAMEAEMAAWETVSLGTDFPPKP